MKLSVAQKVIIGFGFIALLLLVASLSSLWSFSVVSSASQHVNEIAVPAQQQSNSAQIQLLKLAKLSALGYTAEQQAAISKYQADFSTAEQQYYQNIDTLQQLLKTDPQLASALSEASQHYAAYVSAVNQMFSAKLTAVAAEAAAAAELSQLVQLIDERWRHLIGYFLFASARQKSSIGADCRSGWPGRYGQLLTLMQTIRETNAYTDVAQLAESQQNIEFGFSDMQGNLAYIGNLVKEVQAEDLWQDFNQQLAELTERIGATENLVALKTKQLTAAQQAKQQLVTSRTSSHPSRRSAGLSAERCHQSINQLQKKCQPP